MVTIMSLENSGHDENNINDNNDGNDNDNNNNNSNNDHSNNDRYISSRVLNSFLPLIFFLHPVFLHFFLRSSPFLSSYPYLSFSIHSSCLISLNSPLLIFLSFFTSLSSAFFLSFPLRDTFATWCSSTLHFYSPLLHLSLLLPMTWYDMTFLLIFS